MANRVNITGEILRQVVNLPRSGKFPAYVNRDNLPKIGNEATEIPYSDATYIAWLSEGRTFPINRMDDAHIVRDWNLTVAAMGNNTFSEREMRYIVNIAFNLKGIDPQRRPLYRDFPLPPGGTRADGASTNPTYGGMQAVGGGAQMFPAAGVPVGVAEDNVILHAKAASYICCFLLRLANKDETHLMRAVDNIKMQFGKFYGEQSYVINTWSPNDSWARRIKTVFETYQSLKCTLAAHLALAEGNMTRDSPDYGICRMLLFQHLELGGMQIYKMVMTLIADMKLISPAQFLEWITVPQSIHTVNRVYEIGTTYDSPANRNVPHWKYAKIARSTYFLDMNVKHNTFFAYMLADLEVKRGIAGKAEYSNPKNMKALEKLPPDQKIKAETTANIVIELYNEVERENMEGSGLAYRLASGVLPPTAEEYAQEHQGDNNMEQDAPPPPPPPQQPQAQAPPPGQPQPAPGAPPIDPRQAIADMLDDVI